MKNYTREIRTEGSENKSISQKITELKALHAKMDKFLARNK